MNDSMNESDDAAPQYLSCAWTIGTWHLSLEAKLPLWLVT